MGWGKTNWQQNELPRWVKQPTNNNLYPRDSLALTWPKTKLKNTQENVVSSSICWELPKQIPSWKMMGKCRKNCRGRNPPTDHYQNEFPSLGKNRADCKNVPGRMEKNDQGKISYVREKSLPAREKLRLPAWVHEDFLPAHEGEPWIPLCVCVMPLPSSMWGWLGERNPLGKCGAKVWQPCQDRWLPILPFP